VGTYGSGLYGAGFYATPVSAVAQDVWPPRVLVTVIGLIGYSATNVTIYREVGGVRTLIRGGEGVDPAGQDVVLRVDAELPFGVPVRYVAVITSATGSFEVTSVPITVTIEKVAVSDAISGAAAQVVIVAWPDKSHGRQSSTYQVGGRTVVVSGQRSGFTGSIDLVIESDSARENFEALLDGATSGVLQIRQQGGYGGVDSYVAVRGDSETRWSQDGSDQRRRWTLDVVEVESWPLSLAPAEFSLEDLADALPGETMLSYDTETPGTTLLDIATWGLS
jgi:hypothetical protein